MPNSNKGDEAVKDDGKKPRKLQKKRPRAGTSLSGYEVSAVNGANRNG